MDRTFKTEVMVVLDSYICNISSSLLFLLDARHCVGADYGHISDI